MSVLCFNLSYVFCSSDLYTLLVLHQHQYTSTHLATSHLASSIQRCYSSRCRPCCRSHSRRQSLLSWSSEQGPHGTVTAARRVQVAVVRVTGMSAQCCSRRSGAACPGRARHGRFVQVVLPGRGPRPACQRLASAAEAWAAESFKFVFAVHSESPRSRVFGSLALRRLGS